MPREFPVEFQIPIQGFSEGLVVRDTPGVFSGDMNNVRPTDTINRRLRIGQRPGLSKVFTTQIASALSPVVVIGSITVVDYIGT